MSRPPPASFSHDDGHASGLPRLLNDQPTSTAIKVKVDGMPHIILLRAPTPVSESIGNARDSGEPNGLDPYEAALNPFNSTSIPVYETLQKLDELTNILDTDPSAQGLNGVVVTSKRAVDAWASAVENVLDDGSEFWDKSISSADSCNVRIMAKRPVLCGR